MSKAKDALKKFVGEEGYETLHKAIYKDGSRSVLDPNEFLLPLLVVPRTILSWLVQNIRPIKIGEHKEFNIPHVEDAVLWIQKQDTDVYRGEITRKGKVIQTFEKQSLPTLGATIMSAGENYDHLLEEQKDEKTSDAPSNKELIQEHEQLVQVLESKNQEDDKEEAKKQKKELEDLKQKDSSKDIVRHMMSLGDIQTESSDAEHMKWVVSHANIKEMVGVIGKLVDALVAKKIKNESMNKEEIEAGKDQHDLQEAKDPTEAHKKDIKDKKSNPDIIDNKEGTLPFLSRKEMKKLDEDQGAPESKEVKAGKEAQEGKVLPIKKESPKETAHVNWGPNPKTGESLRDRIKKQPSLRSATEGVLKLRQHYNEKAKRQKAAEAALKQHTALEIKKDAPSETGNACSSKTKKLPEPLLKPHSMEKAREMPGGRGMAKMPAGAKAPNPPVPASNAPAAAAAKQSLAAQKGKQAAPKLPGNTQMKAPGSTAQGPKAPKLSVSIAPKAPKAPTAKAEIKITKQEALAKCIHCEKPEFEFDANGKPEFSPCACFRVLRKDDNDKEFEFVKISKNEDGSFGIKFHENADQESVKAFLLILKSKLLIQKKYGIF